MTFSMLSLLVTVLVHVGGSLIWAIRQEGRITVLDTKINMITKSWDEACIRLENSQQRLETKLDAVIMGMVTRKDTQ
jgi:hypothetical protein